MNMFASVAATLTLAAACAGVHAQTAYACDSPEVRVRDMVGLVCESSNPSGHDASVGDPLGAAMVSQRSAPAPVAVASVLVAAVGAVRVALPSIVSPTAASMTAPAVCLPDSQYNPELGDKPSHCYVEQGDMNSADTATLGEAVVYYDPSNYNEPTLFSRNDPLDGAVPVYR